MEEAVKDNFTKPIKRGKREHYSKINSGRYKEWNCVSVAYYYEHDKSPSNFIQIQLKHSNIEAL